MLRSALVLTAVLGATAAAEEVYISIGTDAVETVLNLQGVLPDVDGDKLVLKVAEEELDELSELMHEKHQRCGGFMVHTSLEEALEEAQAERVIEYSIDRDAAVRAVLPALEATKIETTIRELSSFKNRYYMSASGAAASAWLRDRWTALAAGREDVTVEQMSHGYEQASVIMTIRGTTRANEVVVIGGHLDSIAPGGVSANAPGADDDASGVSTLTEVARVLLASGYKPERTIQFMAYAAEEVGLRGSLSIVREYKKRNVNVVGALQLDMTNYQGSGKDIWLIKDYTSAAQNAFLVSLIETYTKSTWGWDACGYACSDHASWHRAGVPASMPFEARFRDSNQAIHTARDTLERSNNNAQHALKFAQLAAAYAIEMGKGDVTRATALTTRDECCDLGMLYGVLAVLGLLLLWRRTGRIG